MFPFTFYKNLIEHPGKTISFMEKYIYKINIPYISTNIFSTHIFIGKYEAADSKSSTVESRRFLNPEVYVK